MPTSPKPRCGKPPVRIVCASELPTCPDCGEPYCPQHQMHYADCPCLGPSEAEDMGATIVKHQGKLWAILP